MAKVSCKPHPDRVGLVTQVFFLFNIFNCFFPYFYADHTPDPAVTGSTKVTALQNL
jgi:hypothetical protein